MSRYLEKHALFPPFFDPPEKKKALIVVIPSHNEPDILTTLNSLNECNPVEEGAEVIVVVNHSNLDADSVKTQNEKTVAEIYSFIETANPWYNLLVINVQFDANHAGVGLARKTGMDEAVRRLSDSGVIACLDADCTVSPDYFVNLKDHFLEHPKASGASIYYEHPLSGSLPVSYYEAILKYELHLRYYVYMQRKLNLPYAFHTVGSSMAVTREAYERVGGMNKKKAGEDFYFIMKLIKYGGFTNCQSTVVYPSPRISDRVPFGTGKAIGDMVTNNNKVEFTTYDPSLFKIVEDFIEICKKYYIGQTISFSDSILGWKTKEFLLTKLQEIKDNTSDYQSFMKRYFKWFDGFQLMKLLHHLRAREASRISIEEAANQVIDNPGELDGRYLLDHYRKIDRST